MPDSSLTQKIRNDVLSWLPTNIVDIHNHIGRSTDISRVNYERKQQCMPLGCYHENTVEQLDASNRDLFPGKQIRSVVFPFPFKEVKIQQANEYCISSEKIPFILGDLNNPSNTCSHLENPKVKGLKIYHDFVDKPYLQRHIDDFLSYEWMKSLNEFGKCLMLHVPFRSLRDGDNLEEIYRLSRDYPESKIILAHMGRCHNAQDMAYCAAQVEPLVNVYFDTSAVHSSDVFSAAFDNIGLGRIMYASDCPYSLLVGKTMEIKPWGAIKITENEFPWSKQEHREWYDVHRPPLTYGIYLQLDAMKSALGKIDVQGLNKIFRENAESILNLS